MVRQLAKTPNTESRSSGHVLAACQFSSQFSPAGGYERSALNPRDPRPPPRHIWSTLEAMLRRGPDRADGFSMMD